MAGRKYTGFDGNAPGQRAGLEKFVQLTVDHFGGHVWNNGTWGPRMARNPGVNKPSVHGTGRAADMSWRRMNDSCGCGDHQAALQVVDFWLANAELFLIEELHDYFPPPFGRGWRCDRSAWKVYSKPTIGSAPGGDWFHVEIAPAHADDPAYYEAAFAGLGSVPQSVPAAEPLVAAGSGLTAPVVPPGVPELSVVFSEIVRPDVQSLQEILIAQSWADFAVADGRFGNRTMNAVISMQSAVGLSGKSVDGKYGPRTASTLAAWLATPR